MLANMEYLDGGASLRPNGIMSPSCPVRILCDLMRGCRISYSHSACADSRQTGSLEDAEL